MDDSDKWKCEHCTYLNFPAAKRCTICHKQRPHQVISDFENSEQDIYKVAERMSQHNKTSPVPSSSSLSPNNPSRLWQCEMCTFLNQPHVQVCAECKIPKEGTPSLKSLPVAKTQPLKIDTNLNETRPCGQPAPNNSSPNSPEAAQTVNNDYNRNLAAYVKSNIKWTCKACTYENWPKSLFCAMCRTPRGKISPLAQSKCISNSGVDAEKVKEGQKRSGQSSPNDSSSGQSSPKNNRSGQSSPNNRSGQNSPNNISPGQNSPKSRSGQNSPNGSKALQISQSSQSGQLSPKGGSGHSSPSASRSLSGANRDVYHNRSKSDVSNEGASGGIKQREDNKSKEKRLQKMRKRLRDIDLIWLQACEGVVNGDPSGVEAFLTSGGDPGRQLTKDEVYILDRPSAFEIGYTLVHLAIRFKRDDMLAVLLTANEMSAKGFKRLPCYSCQELAKNIRRDISQSILHSKREFPCHHLSCCTTFSLPADIEDLPRHIQAQLFDEVIDGDVEKELMEDSIINWSIDLTERLQSRLYSLWNRTAGDCLLDSVLQATWGILDVDNTLRKALSDTLNDAQTSFYHHWKEYESMQAKSMNFTLDESQWQRDWKTLLSLASQPGSSLEQLHIFALAHVLKRPIIVYGVRVVKSFRGENIDFARFQGVYLPLLWDCTFCWKSPVALGYTRGHFSALVPMEIDTNIPVGAGANIDNSADDQIIYLPLVDNEGALLPIHFISASEIGQELTIMHHWMDVCNTQEELLVAKQRIGKRPDLVKQMVDEWLDYYRQQAKASDQCQTNIEGQTLASDGESDQE